MLLQSKDKPAPLRRALAFDKAWATTISDDAGVDAVLTPIAGVVATSSVMDKPEVIAAFEREYAAAVDWLLANPEEAGQTARDRATRTGRKGGGDDRLAQEHHLAAQDGSGGQAGSAGLLSALMELSPAVIGGKLPDDAFYYSE